jgi:LPS-assembly protein
MGMSPGNYLTLAKRLGLSLIFFQISPMLSAQSAEASRLDWVPRAELTEEQLKDCPAACNGAYVNPAKDGTADPGQATIEGLADSSEINTADETALLEGNVEFTQGYRQLKADRVEIDRGQGSIQLEGAVSIREPGILMVGDSASIDSGENRIDISGAQYVIHEARIRGTADRIERSPFGGISIDNATYTTCEPGDEAWVLYASEFHIDEQTGRATARDVKLEVADITVAYVPWFQFSFDDRRASGLLYPEIGYSTDEGFKYSQPYYLNLAPNQDLTLTPRLAAKRGTGLEAEYRLLTEQSYSQISGTFFPSDDINPYYPDNRWASAIVHRGHFGVIQTRIDLEAVSDEDFLDDWATETVTRGDRDLFLQQSAELSAQVGNWQLSAATTGYQNLIEDNYRLYRELPRVGALGTFQFGEMQIEMDSELTRFDLTQNQVSQYTSYLPDQDFLLPEGNRLRFDWSASWNRQETWGYIKPSLGIAYRSYQLDSALLGYSDDAPSAFATKASLDAGMIFERNTSIGDSEFLQTLEPRIFYLYREADDQTDLPVFDTSYASESYEQLFRDSIFVGGDRMEDANRLSLGVQSRFYAAGSGREVLTLGIGQSFYLDPLDKSLLPLSGNNLLNPGDAIFIDPMSPTAMSGFSASALSGSMTSPSNTAPANELQFLSADLYHHIPEQNRNRSELTGEARWNLNDRWSVSANLFWDTEESEIDRSRLEIGYNAIESGNFLKMGYITEQKYAQIEFDRATSSAYLVNQDIAQAFVRGQWKLDEKWGLVFGLQEDLENDRNLDRLFGVSYESCCWNITLGLRDRLERSINDGFVVNDPQRGKSVILSFEFFGLGGVGRSGAELIRSP